jgi:multicomponent K+:H+ antiporter subunit A
MLGIVLSDNILLLLVFWELTSLSSFLLIGYWKHLPEGRQGARMALAVTGGGGLAMIAGMLILGEHRRQLRPDGDPDSGRTPSRPRRSTCPR